jgi:polyphosphate glucokinase
MDKPLAGNQADQPMNVLGIDIGGSAVKGAPVDLKTGRILEERFRVETPDQITPKQMAKAVDQIAKHFKWRGPIGIGFPGVVMGTTIKTAANVHPDFIDCDFGKLVRDVTRCPVSVVNDADAAGLAEMRFGAGKNKKGTVMLFTLGTGVGSAIFSDGVLLPNTELGHFPHKGRSVEKYVAASVRKQANLSWHQWGKRLSHYLVSMEALFWPDLIILGGGVSARSEKFFHYLKTRAPVVAATFENGAGIVGAALHVPQKR